MRTLLLVGLLSVAAARGAPVAEVGYEQRIGQSVPLGTLLIDVAGQERPLGTYFDRRPVVLIFDYLRCPQMCSTVAAGALDGLRLLKLSAGPDYQVLMVSIDPTDRPAAAAQQQAEAIAHYGRPGGVDGWHSLVGRSDQVNRLAAAAGFHFTYDPRSRQYAHPSGLVILTPQGVISRYFLGVDFPGAEMAAALRAAGNNQTGDSVFNLLFVCFQGGAAQGHYSRPVWIVLWLSVLVTMAGVFGGIGWMLRQERRRLRGGAA